MELYDSTSKWSIIVQVIFAKSLKASADMPGSTRGLWNFGSYNYYGYVYGTYPATDGTITEDFGTTTLYNIGNPATPLDQYHLYDVFGNNSEWTARINGIVQFTTNYTSFGYTASPKLGVGQSYFADRKSVV